MTWKQLKDKVNKLTPEQLKTAVIFENNYNELAELEFYIADEDTEGEDIGVDTPPILAGMPYLGY